jgi:glycosyltransferase involved in cell wall biosynthesis
MNQFPVLKDKLHTINNGIVPSLFTDATAIATTAIATTAIATTAIATTAIATTPLEKVKNLFVYTSCPERGLKRLLDLWPKILEVLPDAQLKIAAYNKFPSNADDKKMHAIIQEFSTSIEHCGQLKPTELYKLMGQAEYWLYPSYWPETSCITALEMLYSGVICLYYPCAGLTDTMDSHGFKIKHGDEVDVLTQVINLSKEEKDKLIVAGRDYAASCSWDNRASVWNNLLFTEDKPTVIELSA